MTESKAIKELQSRIDLWENEYAKEIPEYGEALKLAVSALEKQIPTNRELLNQLSDKDFARFVLYDLPEISRRYSDSVGGIAMWLAEKRYDNG